MDFFENVENEYTLKVFCLAVSHLKHIYAYIHGIMIYYSKGWNLIRKNVPVSAPNTLWGLVFSPETRSRYPELQWWWRWILHVQQGNHAFLKIKQKKVEYSESLPVRFIGGPSTMQNFIFIPNIISVSWIYNAEFHWGGTHISPSNRGVCTE